MERPPTLDRSQGRRCQPLRKYTSASVPDGDLARLRFLAARQAHRENAVPEFRLHAARVDRVGQSERARTGAGHALAPMELRLLQAVVRPALSADRQRVVLDRQIDVFTLEA